MCPLLLSDIFGTHRKVLGKTAGPSLCLSAPLAPGTISSGECRGRGGGWGAVLRSTRVQSQVLGVKTCNPPGLA